MWTPFPFVRYCLALMLGISLYVWQEYFNLWLLVLPILSILVYIVVYLKRKTTKIHTLLGFLGLFLIAQTGYFLTYLGTEKNYPHHYLHRTGEFTHYQAVIESLVEEKANSWKATAEVKSLIINGKSEKTVGKVLLYFNKETVEKPHYGDVIFVKGVPKEVDGPKNPEEFDYRRYLSQQNIYYQHYLRDTNFIKIGHIVPNRLINIAYEVNGYADSLLTVSLETKEEYAVANAMILGLRDDLDSDLVQAYSAAGAIHVLSVSGLHVGVIYIVLAGLLAFLKRWGKYGKWYFAGSILVILWFYAIVTGLSSPVLRSTFMFSLLLLAEVSGRQHNSYNTVALSAFGLLCYNPYFLTNVGFQLSYLAVFGMIHIQPMLNPWLQIDKNKNRFNWLADRIWKVTTVAVAAQIATLPITVYYFHQFPNYFLLANPIVILLSSVTLCVGLGFVVIAPILPFKIVILPVSFLLKWSIILLNGSVLFTEGLPHSIFRWLYVHPWEMVLLNILTISMLALISTRRFVYVWISVCITAILVGYNIYEKFPEQNQHILSLHAVSKHTVVSLIDGKKATLLSDVDFLQDRRNIGFRLNNFWASKGVTDTIKINFFNGKSPDYQALIWRGKSFLFLTQSLKGKEVSLSNQTVDYLVVANKAVRKLEEVLGKISFRKLIIDGSYTPFYTERLLQQAREKGIDVYAINKEGTLVLEE